MMRLCLLFFVGMVAVSRCCIAQLVMNYGPLPKAPQEIMILRDYDPSVDLYAQKGHNVSWDISSMRSAGLRPFRYHPAAEQPNSFQYDFLIIDDHGIEKYFRKTGANLDLLFQNKLRVGHLIVPADIRYSEVPTDFFLRIDARSNTTYSYTGEGEVREDELPSELATYWEEYMGKRKKLRVEVKRTVERGSSGKLRYRSFQNWTVREDIIEELTYRLYIWVDGEWKEVLNDDFLSSVPKEHSYSRFFAKDYFYPLAVVKYDEMGKSDWIEYNVRQYEELFDKDEGYSRDKNLTVYPNPAYSFVRFQFENFPTDTYHINVRNIFGQELRHYSVPIKGPDAFTMPLSGLQKGTYLYSVKSGDGMLLTTRRLVVLDP